MPSTNGLHEWMSQSDKKNNSSIDNITKSHINAISYTGEEHNDKMEVKCKRGAQRTQDTNKNRHSVS